VTDIEQAIWPARVQDAVREFHQGDLFDGLPLTYFGDGALPWVESTVADDGPASPGGEFDIFDLDLGAQPPGFGVITSQTCDLCEEGNPAQPCFQAAPAYCVDDDRPTLPAYLAPLEPPDLPAGRWVADLRIEVPIEKTFLIGRRRFAGFPNEAGYLAFAAALGRRRDRAALAAHLVDTVVRTLRKRISNDRKLRKAVRDRVVHSVRLNIEQGTREAPVDVRLHVVIRGAPDEHVDLCERFQTWWDHAREEAEEAGIFLLPNKYHNSKQMDVEVYDDLIPLHIGG
jgi:hypothetical protein